MSSKNDFTNVGGKTIRSWAEDYTWPNSVSIGTESIQKSKWRPGAHANLEKQPRNEDFSVHS